MDSIGEGRGKGYNIEHDVWECRCWKVGKQRLRGGTKVTPMVEERVCVCNSALEDSG